MTNGLISQTPSSAMGFETIVTVVQTVTISFGTMVVPRIMCLLPGYTRPILFDRGHGAVLPIDVAEKHSVSLAFDTPTLA